MDQFLYRETSETLLGCAFKVHSKLGSGFLEKVYENALVYELGRSGVGCEQQKGLKVFYEGIVAGEYVADIVVEDKIIVELKAAKEINSVFEAQLLNYLKATALKVGYIMNFGNSRMEYKRMVLSA